MRHNPAARSVCHSSPCTQARAPPPLPHHALCPTQPPSCMHAIAASRCPRSPRTPSARPAARRSKGRGRGPSSCRTWRWRCGCPPRAPTSWWAWPPLACISCPCPHRREPDPAAPAPPLPARVAPAPAPDGGSGRVLGTRLLRSWCTGPWGAFQAAAWHTPTPHSSHLLHAPRLGAQPVQCCSAGCRNLDASAWHTLQDDGGDEEEEGWEQEDEETGRSAAPQPVRRGSAVLGGLVGKRLATTRTASPIQARGCPLCNDAGARSTQSPRRSCVQACSISPGCDCTPSSLPQPHHQPHLPSPPRPPPLTPFPSPHPSLQKPLRPKLASNALSSLGLALKRAAASSPSTNATGATAPRQK